MVSQPVEQKKYTHQEYLDFEVNSPERHEYLDGEIRPMVGGTPNHGRIVLNFGSILNFGFKGTEYSVFVTFE